MLLIQARNHGRLSNRTLVRKLPDGGWQPLSSFIPSMTVMDADMEESAMPELETGESPPFPPGRGRSIGRASLRDGAVLKDAPENRRCARFIPPWASRGWSWQGVPSIMKSGFFSVSPLLELLFPLAYVVLPVLFLPLAATMVRRLHDVGKSGLFLIWLAVPVVGWLLLMYLCYGESLPGENKYGDPPWS